MDLFAFVSLIGSIGFALSGYMVGVRKEFDVMGLFIVAMLTTSGGGALGDVLLGRPPAVLSDATAFYLVCIVILLAIVLRLHDNKKIDDHICFVFGDSTGLVAFSITGALMGIDAGLSIFGVMVLALVTATGGGILRDILVNETPTLLKSDFYGSVSLLTAAALYGLHAMGQSGNLATSCVFVAALALRMVAYHQGWRLPRIRAQD